MFVPSQPDPIAVRFSSPAIFLDHGVDGERCDGREMRICERGMIFKSRWQFDPGTDLSVNLSYLDEAGSWQKLALCGTVAECEKKGPGCYRVTMCFIELAPEAVPVLKTISAQLKMNAEGICLDSGLVS